MFSIQGLSNFSAVTDIGAGEAVKKHKDTGVRHLFRLVHVVRPHLTLAHRALPLGLPASPAPALPPAHQHARTHTRTRKHRHRHAHILAQTRARRIESVGAHAQGKENSVTRSQAAGFFDRASSPGLPARHCKNITTFLTPPPSQLPSVSSCVAQEPEANASESTSGAWNLDPASAAHGSCERQRQGRVCQNQKSSNRAHPSDSAHNLTAGTSSARHRERTRLHSYQAAPAQGIALEPLLASLLAAALPPRRANTGGRNALLSHRGGSFHGGCLAAQRAGAPQTRADMTRRGTAKEGSTTAEVEMGGVSAFPTTSVPCNSSNTPPKFVNKEGTPTHFIGKAPGEHCRASVLTCLDVPLVASRTRRRTMN